MGDRAVITSHPYSPDNIGIYIHWDGDRPAVEAYLQVCKTLGFRDPTEDEYGWVGLIYVICQYFNYAGTSIGVEKCCNLDTDNGNNGVYLIGSDFKIVGRKFNNLGDEENQERTNKIKKLILDKIALRV